MANIEQGFDRKETQIRVYVHRSDMAEVWIEQKGLEDGLPEKYQTLAETLAYATINELIELRNELNGAIAKLAGLGEDRPL